MGEKVIKLCNRDECTACMSCFNTCGFHAIEMKEDELGALIPEINEEKCKKCGKCTNACPILNPPERNAACEAIALYTKNEDDRKTCASGGVSTTFARNVIEAGGAVFGVGFSPDGTPIYKKAETMAELEEFKGSKYVYCFPGLIYQEAEKELKTGRKCLFVGTPCYVAGLLNYLGKGYSNLITVDFICHGTPPFSYLKDYITSLKIPEYSRLSFRGKHDFYLDIYGKEGQRIYSRKYEEDEYFYSFMNGLIFRKPCRKCEFAVADRVSDITIGDFWGIAPGALEGYKGKISVALPNTQKGKEFLLKNSDSFVCEKRSYEEAIKGNTQLRRPSEIHKDCSLFDTEYKRTKSFSCAVKASAVPKETKKNRIRNTILAMPRFVKHNLLKR